MIYWELKQQNLKNKLNFGFFTKCNSSLRLTILLCQINTDFDSILDPLHLKHFLLFIHNHLFNKLTILMIKNSCSFNVNNQRWFFNDMIDKLLRKIETKVMANWSKKISLYNHFIILTVLSVWFFGSKWRTNCPFATKTKEKRFFERITSLLGGERTPHSVALFSSIRLDAWVGGWVLQKLFFHFKWRWRCKKKIPNSCLELLSSRKVDFQTNEKIALY